MSKFYPSISNDTLAIKALKERVQGFAESTKSYKKTAIVDRSSSIHKDNRDQIQTASTQDLNRVKDHANLRHETAVEKSQSHSYIPNSGGLKLKPA